ncbi:protein indeterminate-domain 6, chloroplastic-like [Solanum stenotomum]|uniref:protein indeterminate-domain 6, chloroplastic-like n=1 Tax=Solanum stenotomum TaxID=172797 RepID=UPI0020D06F1F|nr:protein indeterminate-domain 6, chloroplastic-like [Solanum stenotomum]
MSGEPSSVMFLAMREEEQIKQQQQQQQQHEILLHQQQQQHGEPPSSSTTQSQQATKKRRNQPGTPNPDAEIIALSPKTLMATNRFVCEVCNKGFQREQNLQLHRRGHNLPWKLKQKSTKEVKRKVYLCPEPSCVHHEPSRALGDLTGIKKHYSRKHGEKKYKCEKCSKKYAVQSDWKAHTKTCGTREYRCDCGTLFSRRDSFITHRAFCDALAQESARNPPSLSSIGSHLYGSSNNNNMSLGGLSKLNSQIPDHHEMLHFGGGNNNNNNNNTSGGAHHHHHHHNQFDNNNNNLIGSSAFRPSTSFFQLPADQTSHQDYGAMNNNKPSIHGLMQLPNLHNNNANVATGSSSMFNLNFFQNNNNNNNNNVVDNDHNSNISGGLGGLLLPSPHQFSNNTSGEGSNNSSNIFSSGTLLNDHHHHHHHHMSSSIPSLYVSSSPAPPMSATALLQKAAQMGSTTSCNNSTSASLLKAFGSVVSVGAGVGGSSSSAMKSDLHPPPAVNFGGVYGHEDPMSAGNHLHDLVVNAYGAQDQNQDYGGVIGGYNTNNKMNNYDQPPPQKKQMISNNFSMDIGMREEANRLTRDFLGVGEIVRNMSSGGGGFSSSQQQMSSLDDNNNNSESRKNQNHHHQQPFGGGTFQ